MNDTERGTGRTMRQLQSLPSGCWFVVAHQPMLGYTKALAHAMRRGDIKILTVAQCGDGNRFMGMCEFTFAVDHAVYDIILAHYGRLATDRWMRTQEIMLEAERRSARRGACQ